MRARPADCAPGRVPRVAHPVVEAARRVAEELLEPAAAEVDLGTVPRSHLDAIGAAGLLGLAAPTESGGVGADASVARQVGELLAGADLATWFVQAQHHSPVRMLVAHPSQAAERYLRPLATGELIAGIAFSQLRRFPRRLLTATRTASGWRFDGIAPWYTGWGLNDVAFLAGLTDTDDVVFGVVPARAGPSEGPGLHAQTKVRVAALDAACTVVLQVDDAEVDDADVVLVQPHAQWLADDSLTSSNANPAIFGVTQSAIRLLHATAQRRGEPTTGAAADALARRLDAVRLRAYELADERFDGVIARRLAVRAEALELAVASTSALVAADSGPAMGVTAAAQRKAREALFLLVQAQTAAARKATLQRWHATWSR